MEVLVMTVEMENILIESMQREDEMDVMAPELDSVRETMDFLLGINEDGSIDTSNESLF
jgi:hypothetical protein